VDPVGAEGVGRHHGHQRRVDAPGKADHDVGETVLGDVIPGPDHEGPVDLLDRAELRGDGGHQSPVVDPPTWFGDDRGDRQGWGRRPAPGIEQALSVDRTDVKIDQRHAFLELRQGGQHVAVRVEHKRRPVEDEFVLPTDQVDVDEGAGGVGGPGGEHARAFSQPAGVIRRGVDIDHQLGAGGRLLGDRPEGTPGVLADRDADPDAPDQEQLGGPGARREIALLVKDAVVGQRLLVVHALHLPEGTDGGGVIQVGALVDEADHRRAALGCRRHLAERLQVVGNEPGLQQEVLRG